MKPFALERFLSKHEFTVRHYACASDPDTLTVDEVLALEPGATERLLAQPLGYTDTKGSLELREAIAALTPGLAVADVLVHVGAEEPIFTFFRSTVSAGDEVIALTPTYQSLTSLAEAFGAQVLRWNARERDGWQPDVEELAKLISPRTKVVVINTPQNPVGSVLTPDRFEAVCRLVEQHGLWLLGDEVYRGLEYGAATLPSVVERVERSLALGALAKVYGLAGLRIGWAASKNHLRLGEMETVKDYLSICAPGPSELLASIALRNAAALKERTKTIVRRNVDEVEALISRFPTQLGWTRPTAGTTGFLHVKKGAAEAWAMRALHETGVLFAPSVLFGFADTHVRIGLGRSNLSACLAALSPWLERQR
jgi:aspartate/methionine/tyrosine aminotransferase